MGIAANHCRPCRGPRNSVLAGNSPGGVRVHFWSLPQKLGLNIVLMGGFMSGASALHIPSMAPAATAGLAETKPPDPRRGWPRACPSPSPLPPNRPVPFPNNDVEYPVQVWKGGHSESLLHLMRSQAAPRHKNSEEKSAPDCARAEERTENRITRCSALWSGEAILSESTPRAMAVGFTGQIRCDKW